MSETITLRGYELDARDVMDAVESIDPRDEDDYVTLRNDGDKIIRLGGDGVESPSLALAAISGTHPQVWQVDADEVLEQCDEAIKSPAASVIDQIDPYDRYVHVGDGSKTFGAVLPSASNFVVERDGEQSATVRWVGNDAVLCGGEVKGERSSKRKYTHAVNGRVCAMYDGDELIEMIEDGNSPISLDLHERETSSF